MGGLRGRRDRAAFERFCTDEYGRLVGAIALVLSDHDVAADAVNEALARAWNRVRRGQDIESIGAWVRVVALNIARDQFRRRALERKHAATMLAIPSVEATSEWRLDVQAAIEALPQRQR